MRQGWVQEKSVIEGRKRQKTYQVMDPEAFEDFFNTLAQTIADLPDGPPPHLSPLKHLQDRQKESDELSESSDHLPVVEPSEDESTSESSIQTPLDREVVDTSDDSTLSNIQDAPT